MAKRSIQKASIRWGNTKYRLSDYRGWQFFEFIPPSFAYREPIPYILENILTGTAQVTYNSLTYTFTSAIPEYQIYLDLLSPFKAILSTSVYKADLDFSSHQVVAHLLDNVCNVVPHRYIAEYTPTTLTRYEVRRVVVVGQDGKPSIVVPGTLDGGTYKVPGIQNCDGGSYLGVFTPSCVCDGGLYE